MRSSLHLHWLAACAACLAVMPAVTPAQTLRVDASHPVNQINPERSLGTTVDRLWSDAQEKGLEQPMLGRILAMGLKPISYRQNTELQAQAWHWNPTGTWSDAAHQQGYFVGSPTPGPTPIRHSWGYTLPDRSTSLVDGKLDTYWKSNPYLTQPYTHEPDSAHPQWVIVDLGRMEPVNAVRIAWGDPYATHYQVQFWTAGEESPRSAPTKGVWQAFDAGVISNGQGGTVTLPLTPLTGIGATRARYLRVLMTASSGTCARRDGGAGDAPSSQDKRDCLGYAIRELYAGTLQPGGQFIDLLRHAVSTGRRDPNGPTRTQCSSVDPWHRASDVVKTGDQVGFDYFFHSGITSGLPTMVPIAMLYANPQTAANEIAYIEARHYPISYVEMGEEPDGQWAQPQDDAALYIQFAAALHRVDPKLKLGGPVFEGHNQDIETWPDAEGRVSWLGRYVAYLKDHGRLGDLAFVSFEHYPLACDPGWDKLYQEPELIQHVLDLYRADGVPQDVPLFVTETNYSAQSGPSGVSIFGALWEADYVGALFDGGGAATYYFHAIPHPFPNTCGQGGGILGAINVDDQGQFQGYLSQYFANQLISQQWFQPVDKIHQVYHVSSDVTDQAGNTVVSGYALLRPDGQWSLLVINNDRRAPHAVHIAFQRGRNHGSAAFSGKVTTVTFGAAQYQWHPNPTSGGGTANPDGPAVTASVNAGQGTWFSLPEASITVIRGHIQ